MRHALLILLFLIPSSFAAEVQPMITESALHDSSVWLALLHADASGQSRVDDPTFFLASNDDPKAELTANLRELISSPTNYVCRFPARAHWLFSTRSEGTHNPPPDFPTTFPTCPELETALNKLKPDTAVVMFASEYLGNPSSAFGHTFLVFQRAGRSRLLSQAVNYAARVDTRSAGNAWKGLTGQLPGQYQILPTFEKVKEYNDLAQRDIWEYELDLDPAEVRQLFRHVWELEGIRSDYWFLDENCAFNLLQLLDVARPAPTHAQSLSQQASKLTVLPGDVTSLLQRSGLVRKRTFRPALARDIAAGLKASSVQGRKDALKLARGEVEAERVQERSALETAGLILQAWKGSKRIEPEPFDLRYNAILARRSELGPSPAEENKPGRDPADRPPMPPDEMPRSRLLGLSGGVIEGIPDNGERADKNFAELQFRLLGHDILDRPEPEQSSQLELGHLRLRAFEDEIKIEEITLLELLSVSPHEPVFQRKSWQFRAGMERFHPSESDQTDALLGLLEGSVGKATGPFYVLAGAELRTDLHDEALLGPELTLGAFTVTPGRSLRSHLSASLAYHVGTRSDWHPEVHWNSRFRLAPRLDLTFDAAIRSERVREVRGGFAWNW